MLQVSSKVESFITLLFALPLLFSFLLLSPLFYINHFESFYCAQAIGLIGNQCYEIQSNAVFLLFCLICNSLGDCIVHFL